MLQGPDGRPGAVVAAAAVAAAAAAVAEKQVATGCVGDDGRWMPMSGTLPGRRWLQMSNFFKDQTGIHRQLVQLANLVKCLDREYYSYLGARARVRRRVASRRSVASDAGVSVRLQ